MAELILDKFHAGVVTHPSETELPRGAALKAENVNFDALGKLKSRKGYKLEFAGPTGITIIGDPFKYEFNLPGSFGRKEVILVYGQDGSSRDTLWWRPYWDTITEAWIDAWRELTEFEGPYTADTNTTTSEIEATAGELDNQATNEYYTDFVIVNITRQASIVVGDYTAATRILGHKANRVIASQASGDIYFLYRFSLFMTVEGPYTTDANTTTTILLDAELRSTVDDYYNGSTIVNTGPGGSGSAVVSDYDGSKKKLTHPSIAGQTSGDSYYIYTTTHNIRVNGNTVRFFPRQNAIEISLGNDEQYPLKSPLWFGFIRSRYYFNDDTNMGDTRFEGFWFARNVIAKPDVASMNVIVDSGGGTLAEATWYFKISFIYDGYQESPLSNSFSLNPAGTNAINLNLRFPHWSSDSTAKPSVFDAIFNKRITHVRLYAAKDTAGDSKDDYFLIQERAISSDEIGELATIAWNILGPSYFQFASAITFDDDLWNGVTFLEVNGFTVGKFLRWAHNQGHKSERVDANFKFRATLEEQHYKAPIFTDQQRDAFVGYSVQDNGNGVPVDDVIPHENFLNLDQKGVVEITGLTTIRGKLVILTPNKIFVYAPGRSLSDFPVERGNIAERGFISVDDTLYFSASDDFYAFDGLSTPKKLMFGKILDQWQTISDTNKQSAFVGYSKKTDSIFLVVAGTIFIHDRIFDAWRTHTTDVTFVGFTTRRDGVLFAATASNIYELQSDSFTEVVTTNWESRLLDFTKELGDSRLPIAADVNKVIMKHKGDKRVKVSMFDPSESTTFPKATLTFFPESNGKPVERVVSFKANQLKVKIEDIDPGTPQPSSEIDYLRIEYEPISGEF